MDNSLRAPSNSGMMAPSVSPMLTPMTSTGALSASVVSGGHLMNGSMNVQMAPSETPEVHSDEVYCMDYISDMKVTDALNLTNEGGLLFLEDTWRTEWEKPVQVTRRTTLERELEMTDAPEDCILSNVLLYSNSVWGGLSSRGLIKEEGGITITTAHPSGFSADETKTIPAGEDAINNDVSSQLHLATSLEVGEQQQQQVVGLMEQSATPIVTKYSCDEQDLQWITSLNEELTICASGLSLSDTLLEFVFDFMEETTHARLQSLVHSEKADGIEYDENTLCDVCREGTCEEGNEILFCDKCDIAVHQGCYGIFNVPEEDWLCRTCYLGIKPRCFLCAQTGGAMKSTLNGKRWCHVSCVLWIPETSFGDLYKMEPVVQLKNIPDSRWALVCTLCREKVGACIQCSYKTCAISYHVTCGFDHNLDITTTQHPTTGDLIFKSYCLKHTAERRKKNASATNQPTNHQRLNSVSQRAAPQKNSPSTKHSQTTSPSFNKQPKDENAMMKNRINKALCKFHTLVTSEEISRKLNVNPLISSILYEYWKLKRISGALFHNRISLPNNSTLPSEQIRPNEQTNFGLVDLSLTAEQQEQIDAAESLRNRATMFVALRQDFEKVRSMVNLIQKRERALKTYHRVCYEMFKRQLVLAGFKLLPDILCPPSDLSIRKKDDVTTLSSTDEGICSGEFSETDGASKWSSKSSRKRDRSYVNSTDETTTTATIRDKNANEVKPKKRKKIASHLNVNGLQSSSPESSGLKSNSSQVNSVDPYQNSQKLHSSNLLCLETSTSLSRVKPMKKVTKLSLDGTVLSPSKTSPSGKLVSSNKHSEHHIESPLSKEQRVIMSSVKRTSDEGTIGVAPSTISPAINNCSNSVSSKLSPQKCGSNIFKILDESSQPLSDKSPSINGSVSPSKKTIPKLSNSETLNNKPPPLTKGFTLKEISTTSPNSPTKTATTFADFDFLSSSVKGANKTTNGLRDQVQKIKKKLNRSALLPKKTNITASPTKSSCSEVLKVDDNAASMQPTEHNGETSKTKLETSSQKLSLFEKMFSDEI